MAWPTRGGHDQHMTSETAPGTGGEERPDRTDPARRSAGSGDPTPSTEPDVTAARADSAPVSGSDRPAGDPAPADDDTAPTDVPPADASVPAGNAPHDEVAAHDPADPVPPPDDARPASAGQPATDAGHPAHADPTADDTDRATQAEPGTGDAERAARTEPGDADRTVPVPPDDEHTVHAEPGAGEAERAVRGEPADEDRTVPVDPVPPADESPTEHVDPSGYGAAGPFPPPGGTVPPRGGARSGDAPPPGPGTPPPGYGPPPGFGGPGTPPPAGELPPIAAFAFRHKLVRPVQGKKIVGVCAALGRATNTDPVLWRVVLVVTAFFGGVGLLAYVVGWLTTPREDERATPLESLFGRGRSSTSPALTVLLGVVGVGLVFFILNDSFRFTVLAAALAATVAVVLTRRSQARSTAPASTGGGPVPAADTPAPEPGPVPGPGAPSAAPQPEPAAAGYSLPPTGVQQPAYRAPFAPHGPYGPGVPPPPPPPQFHARPPKRPKRPREKSALGRLTFFALCLALGGLAVLAVLGLHVPASGFFALGLAVIGTGLVVGAWRGRARWLIAIGCVFALALPISWVSERADWDSVDRPDRYAVRDMTWAPRSVGEIRPEYRTTVGDATLDLSAVDFTGAAPPPPVRVNAEVGDVKVILPKDLDVTVEVGPGAGDAMILGQETEGPQHDRAPVTDDGDDGPGGPRLTLDVQSGVGNVEVTR